MPFRPLRLVAALVAAAFGGAPVSALAHHPMGGAVPATLWQGFASGLGHPVIGLDHLAFIIAAGVLAAGADRRAGMLTLAAFVTAGVAGSVMHLARGSGSARSRRWWPSPRSRRAPRCCWPVRP